NDSNDSNNSNGPNDSNDSNRSHAVLTIHRTAPSDMQERELYVSVDGGPNTILRFGDSVTLRLIPGHHRLRVHNTLSRRHAAFDAAAGEEIRFRAANVRGKGFE